MDDKSSIANNISRRDEKPIGHGVAIASIIRRVEKLEKYPEPISNLSHEFRWLKQEINRLEKRIQLLEFHRKRDSEIHHNQNQTKQTQ